MKIELTEEELNTLGLFVADNIHTGKRLHELHPENIDLHESVVKLEVLRSKLRAALDK